MSLTSLSSLLPPPPLPDVTIVTSGTCETSIGGGVIQSVSACSAAAAVLGLSDTSASDDNQSPGVSFYPPYCYYSDGSLKFNSLGLNTGRCTVFDRCLCWVVPPPLTALP